MTQIQFQPDTWRILASMSIFGKAILLLKKLIKDNDFWQDEEGLTDISGVKLRKACKRSQQMKDDHFGQESKIGLYRVASKGRISISGASRWVNLINCDEICKNIIKQMRLNDDNHLALKRLALLQTTKIQLGGAANLRG